MRTIDPKWSGFSAGYREVLALQARLENEFGRAVQAGRRWKFRRELTEWQKKRRVFFALAAFAPLSIAALCLSAFYFREMACVIVYWAVLVVIILVTLAVAGRSYIQEAMNQPQEQHVKELGVDLERRWWASLAPERPAPAGKIGGDPRSAFLDLLAGELPDSCLTVPGLLPAGVLVLAPSGLWLFTLQDWDGSIRREDGRWKQAWEGKKEKTHETGPDDEWLEQQQEISRTLKQRLPQHARTPDPVQGGSAFTHPEARLDKARIRGNTASYGPAGAWATRLRRASPLDGFTLDLQLEILDALVPGAQPAKDEAERLYREAVEELRAAVAEMTAHPPRKRPKK